MMVFACLHTSLPIPICMYSALAIHVLSLPNSNLTPSCTAKTTMIFPFSDFPQEFSYLAQTLTPRCTLVCVCCFLAPVAIAWVSSTLAPWTWLTEHLHHRCSCLALLVFLCSRALHAIASAASWNPFSNIPLHVPWLLPYPIVLAPLHISYS